MTRLPLLRRFLPAILALNLIFVGGCTTQDITDAAEAFLGGGSSEPTTGEMSNGLKQALELGIAAGSDRLSQRDGYFMNQAIKIMMPPEAQKVENALRNIGADFLVDEAIELFNRAAEDAASNAKPIFVDAIRNMSFADVRDILLGGNTAGTDYLKRTTFQPLEAAFSPVIDNSLGKVGADRAWSEVMGRYNMIPFVEDVNTDLTGYVTERALDGLFFMVEREETRIRENANARVNDLLQKVFGWADAEAG